MFHGIFPKSPPRGFLYSSRRRARGTVEVPISSWLPCGYWRKWQYLCGSHNRAENAEQAQEGDKMKISSPKGCGRPMWVTPCIKMLDMSQAGAKITMWIFKKLFIYLAALGLSCNMQDSWSLLQCAAFLVAAWGI